MPEPVGATTTNLQPANRRRRILLVFALVLGAIAVVVLRLSRPPPLPPVMLLSPNEFSAQITFPLLERWIPPTWGWFWRSKEVIFGKRKGIAIDGLIFKGDMATDAIAEANLERE